LLIFLFFEHSLLGGCFFFSDNQLVDRYIKPLISGQPEFEIERKKEEKFAVKAALRV
jgi:hypothetical protein